MFKLQVKNATVYSFPSLRLEKTTFWKYDSGSTMSRVDISGGYPDGDEAFAKNRRKLYGTSPEAMMFSCPFLPTGVGKSLCYAILPWVLTRSDRELERVQ